MWRWTETAGIGWFWSRAVTWAGLIALTGVLIAVLRVLHVPAALMLGPMAEAIVVTLHRPGLTLPRWTTIAAQALLACLIARAMSPAILLTLVPDWPILLGMNLLSTGSIMALGFVAARLNWLPGTAAIWGMSPGGASAMVLLSESYGADKRLVALMQYLRVVTAALAVVAVGSAFGTPHHGTVAVLPGGPNTPWFAFGSPRVVLVTALLAFAAAAIAIGLKRPTLVLFLPVFGGIALQGLGRVELAVPPIAAGMAFTVIGWHIGLGFTRASLFHSARLMPRIVTGIGAILLLCAGLAWLLAEAMDLDFLTAYLALNPGGTDAVVIVAANVAVNLPLVMAMQIARLILVLLLAPLLGRWGASRHLATARSKPSTGEVRAEAVVEDTDILG